MREESSTSVCVFEGVRNPLHELIECGACHSSRGPASAPQRVCAGAATATKPWGHTFIWLPSEGERGGRKAQR
jgi:hypothetical protein